MNLGLGDISHAGLQSKKNMLLSFITTNSICIREDHIGSIWFLEMEDIYTWVRGLETLLKMDGMWYAHILGAIFESMFDCVNIQPAKVWILGLLFDQIWLVNTRKEWIHYIFDVTSIDIILQTLIKH